MDVIAGRYEVIKVLEPDSVGMGYLCQDRELGGLLMLRVLFSDLDQLAIAGVHNSIISFISLSHPNVMHVYEFVYNDDLVLYSMEYPGGPELTEKLDTEVAIGEAVHILKQVAQGLEAIHSHGIIYRDLKPEVIYLANDGTVKIAPSIVAIAPDAKLTETGEVLGVVDYVSPEYLEKGETTYLADIYALGIIGYELVTGKLPFRAKSVIDTMTQRLKGLAVPPTEIRKDCPEELSNIIIKAMNKNPAKRYQSAKEIAQALEELES